jgi:hypothetical protein
MTLLLRARDGMDQAWIRFCLVLGVLICIAMAPPISPVSPLRAYGAPASPFRDFPLWREVPVRRFAALKEGENRRGTRWGVFAYRRPLAQTAGAREMPCLLLSKITDQGQYGTAGACGSLAPSRGRSALPVSVEMGLSYRTRANRPFTHEFFVAMTFAPVVRQVRIEVAPERFMTFETRYISARQSKKARLSRFRFIAVSLPLELCVGDVIGFDAVGEVVLDADFNECSLVDATKEHG